MRAWRGKGAPADLLFRGDLSRSNPGGFWKKLDPFYAKNVGRYEIEP
jgi:hypothetical protein